MSPPSPLAGARGLLLLSCLVAWPAAAGPPSAFSDRVASEVGEQAICLSELLDRTALVFEGMKTEPPKPGQALSAEQNKILAAGLLGLEQERLIAAEAERLKIVIDQAEVDGAIDQVARSNGLSRQQLLESLPKSGYDEATYRAELSRQLTRMRLFRYYLAEHPGLDPTEPRQIDAEQARWLEGLAGRWPVIRHVAFGAGPKKARAGPPASDACQGAPDLPVFHWTLTAATVSLPAGRIARIRFETTAGPLPEGLEGFVASKAGAALDPATVREDLVSLWGSGLFDDAAAAARNEKDGLVLVNTLRPRPRVAKITVDAAGVMREPVVAGTLALVQGRVLQPDRFVTGRARLLDQLKRDGYLEAALQVRHRLVDASRVDICVRIQPGPKYSHGKVRFEGTSVLTAEILRACLGARPEDELPARADRLIVLINACAYDRGLLEVRVHSPEQDIDRAHHLITPVIRIEEGKVFVLNKLELAGDLIAPADVYRAHLALKAGGVFNRTRLAEAMRRIDAMHAAYGRDDLQVVPETNIDPDAGRIDITLRISER